MNKNILSDYSICATDNLLKAVWKFNQNGKLLVVLDEGGRYMGSVTQSSLASLYGLDVNEAAALSALSACNQKYPACAGGAADPYSAVRNLMADNENISHVPVLNEDGQLTDIFSRHRAFYRRYYNSYELPRMHYAFIINKALQEAKALGHKSISVLEFGLATGNSLIECEFHARELGRIYGLDVEVYGFDSGQGLPALADDVKDMAYCWEPGFFAGNMARLGERLDIAKLVIGDLTETAPSFIEKYNPAVIGAMMIDVDLYSSTVPILDILQAPSSCFMPRVQMYFDDIFDWNEFAGENLAIKEFNSRNDRIKISPEHCSVGRPDYKVPNVKTCHLFDHPLYNKTVKDYGPYPPLRPFI